MGQRCINIPNRGKVLFEKSRKARRTIITIRPFLGVRVAVPYSCSYKTAEKFVYEKMDWIKENLTKIRSLESKINDFQSDFKEFDIKNAESIISERIETLSDNYNLKYNRLYFRQQKTRWGSCSAKNNISLNIKLACLPEHLMDYVIIHELLHVKYKAHKKRFNSELSNLAGDIKSLDKGLKSFQYILY